MTPLFHQRCAITAPLVLPVVSKVIERNVILDYSQCSLTSEQKTANGFCLEKTEAIFLDL